MTPQEKRPRSGQRRAAAQSLKRPNLNPKPTTKPVKLLDSDPAALLKAALELHAYGFNVLPIRHRPETGGKQPAVRNWKQYQEQRQTEAGVRKLFDQEGLHGVAIILGPVSGGIGCIDFDRREDYEAWARVNPIEAAAMPTVLTARGAHVYFRTKAKFSRFDGGEMRTAASYVLAPPSVHPTGKRYTWVVPLPALLSDLKFVEEPFDYFLGHVGAGINPIKEERTSSDSLPLCTPSLCISVHDPRVVKAIEATIPKKMGRRNDCIFELARRLKGIPELRDLPPEVIKPIFKEWHRRAIHTIGTPDFDLNWAIFVNGWLQVLFPMGEGLEGLLIEADKQAFPLCVMSYESETTRRLIRLLWHLSQRRPEGVFFLSCREAGRLFGMSHNDAARLLKLLVHDRILEVKVESTKTRATRYRYLGGVPDSKPAPQVAS